MYYLFDRLKTAGLTPILEFLKTNSTITNRQAREIAGIRSEKLVKIEFYKLRDEGLLEMVPGLKGQPLLGGSHNSHLDTLRTYANALT